MGCDIAKVETYAVRVIENGKTVAYRLTGEKFFITNSAKQDGEFLASMLVVIARIVDRPEELRDSQSQKRYGAFIVETQWPGCSVTRLRFEGVRGIYNGAPKFDNVYVPVENRLGSEEDGLRIALATLDSRPPHAPRSLSGGPEAVLVHHALVGTNAHPVEQTDRRAQSDRRKNLPRCSLYAGARGSHGLLWGLGE